MFSHSRSAVECFCCILCTQVSRHPPTKPNSQQAGDSRSTTVAFTVLFPIYILNACHEWVKRLIHYARAQKSNEHEWICNSTSSCQYLLVRIYGNGHILRSLHWLSHLLHSFNMFVVQFYGVNNFACCTTNDGKLTCHSIRPIIRSYEYNVIQMNITNITKRCSFSLGRYCIVGLLTRICIYRWPMTFCWYWTPFYSRSQQTSDHSDSAHIQTHCLCTNAIAVPLKN